MTYLVKRALVPWLLLPVLAVSMSLVARADVAQGVDAFLEGNRIIAWRELLPAATEGDATAQFYVGTMYRHGFGTERDAEEAAFWLRKAAVQGHGLAKFVLGFDLIQREDFVAAAPQILDAARAGIAAAQYYAGRMLRDGSGVGKDVLQALGWLLLAAEQDYVAAQYEVAGLLANPPEDVTLDLVSAYRWFDIAAHAGYPAARESRDRVGNALSPQEVASAQAEASAWIRSHR
jgi:TPR repeat protein